jgi:hypothetical protein
LKALEPGNFDFLFALADHYVKTNQLDRGVLAARKMIELFPDNQTGYDILKYATALKKKQTGDGSPQSSNTYKTKTGKTIRIN